MKIKPTAVLTICSRNYLGQALTLRKSVLKHNPNFDFYLYLADDAGDISQPWIIPLSDTVIPDWKTKAFKYDVIEFNTCIKPFCIESLFKMGYDQVLYIDPDIYLFDSLDCIVETLKEYSIMLTPHRIKMMEDIDGFVNDVAISQNGIFNLGFCAIKNDNVGNQIVKWWQKRLETYCYNEAREGLAVDQKWMDFIPAYFPKDTFISQDPGMNFAIWNINEREVSYQDGKALVNIKGSNEKYSLKFFHFSGYSPEIPNRLDKRDPSSDLTYFPAIKPLVNEYYDAEIENDFFYYRKYQYAFNTFNNGTKILPLNRRIFRIKEQEWKKCGDPFDSSGFVYQTFKSNNLLSKVKIDEQVLNNIKHASTNRNHQSLSKVHKIMKATLRIVGVDKYQRILRGFFGNLSKFENNTFLLKDD